MCFSQVMRFLCELSPRTTMYELNCPAISLLGGELALPNRVARVSRFDRQLRYYSEALKLASVLSMNSTGLILQGKDLKGFVSWQKITSIRENAAPNGAALRSCICHWPPGICRPAVLRRTFCRFIRPVSLFRVRSLAVALAGACSTWLTDLR